MKALRLFVASTLLTAAAFSLHAQTVTTIVDDTFSDSSSRASGTLSTTRANWYVLSNNSTTQGQTVVTGGSNGTALSVDTHSIVGSSNAYMMRWTPTTLSVGDTLTVSLQLSFTRLPTTVGLRFGIFDSTPNGVISGDVTSLNQASFVSDTGYSFTGAGSLNIGTNSQSGSVFNAGERTTFTAGNLFSAGADFTALGTGNGTNGVWAINTPYTFTMSFNLVSGTTLNINQSISGGIFGSGVSGTQVVDTTASATTFDYMLFRSATGSAFDVTFQELNVALASPAPVPEVSTYALLAGAGALGLALWRRRAARCS